MKATLPTLACLLLGVAAGWFSGVAPADPPGEAAADRLSPRQTRERQRAASRVVPADVAVRLAPIHAAETPQERLRAVIHLARTIPVSELARWYDSKWLKLQDRRDLAVFYEITRNRWLAEDPQGIMERARTRNWNNFTNGNNFNEIANRWARSDPDGALAFVKTLGIAADQARFLSATLRSLAESRPTEVLSLAKTHLDPVRDSHQWTEALRSLAKHHPGLLESADLPAEWLKSLSWNSPDDVFKPTFMTTLGGGSVSPARPPVPTVQSLLAGLADDPANTSNYSKVFLEFSSAAPPVKQAFEKALLAMEPERLAQIAHANASGDQAFSRFPPSIQTEMISAMLQHPPQQPGRYFKNAVLRMASGTAAQWAQDDPLAASRWAGQLPLGEARQWALRNVAANWMPYDPVGAQIWIGELAPRDEADIREFLKAMESLRR
jgi:hypothetical protein